MTLRVIEVVLALLMITPTAVGAIGLVYKRFLSHS